MTKTTSAGAAPEREAVTRIMAGLRAAFRELRCAGSQRMLRAGVSMAHLHVMTLLERHGEMPMSRIAELQDVSFSNATGLIDRIEERGLVERVRVPDDRRVVQVRLTEDGLRKLREVELFKEDMMQRVLGKLDDEQLAGVSRAMDDLRVAVEELVREDPAFFLHHHDHEPPAPDRDRA